MADRTQFQTDPVTQDRYNDRHPVPTAAMSQSDFANAVRAVKLGRGIAAQVRHVGREECVRLEVIPASRFAIGETPDGSNQFDGQSLFTWMRRIQPGDTAAITQLIALTATAGAVPTLD